MLQGIARSTGVASKGIPDRAENHCGGEVSLSLADFGVDIEVIVNARTHHADKSYKKYKDNLLEFHFLQSCYLVRKPGFRPVYSN